MDRKKKKELWAQEAEIMLAVTDDSNFCSVIKMRIGE